MPRVGLTVTHWPSRTLSTRGLTRLRYLRSQDQHHQYLGTAVHAAPKGPTEQVFLSDLIAFETDAEKSATGSDGLDDSADPTAKVQEIIDRATKVLEAARQALGTDTLDGQQAAMGAPEAIAPPAAASAPTTSPASTSGGPDGSGSVVMRIGSTPQPPAGGGGGVGVGRGPPPSAPRWSPLGDEPDLTRHVLQTALDEMQRSGGALKDGDSLAPSKPTFGPDGLGAAPAGEGGDALPPSWAQSFLSAPRDGSPGSDSSFADILPENGSSNGGSAGGSAGSQPSNVPPPMQLQAAPRAAPSALSFAELEAPPAPTAALLFVSQEEEDLARARSAVLPPLQSIMELTSAFRPPDRSAGMPAAEEGAPMTGPAQAGRTLADGVGALPDGSTWEKKSGVEYGENGYWKRWHLLRGTAMGGKVQWEETWWEASDWTGFKEMGAEKSGNDAAGGAWRESWMERLHYVGADLDCVVERNAHKWAHDAGGDEWEEKWGEYYHAGGRVDKYADKWGKQGPNVWHEKWGEDYDGVGAVVKWTDKWAERLLPGGAREQWGDKWREAFASGRGQKNGEVWSSDAGGNRYQRWWGEDHPGDGTVRRHGHSTTGEQWDESIHMDTYYNPVPHFGYKLALDHSPQLKSVPLRPKEVDEDDPFGPGIDDL